MDTIATNEEVSGMTASNVLDGGGSADCTSSVSSKNDDDDET
eukprot:CAMPEP_0202463050 /NCGR_PEP_ID=MMETSP1360-20130828/56462_1 /ASSEMBLY_ACC=CAM_ASM_000848 /TAXON_ID=515479 /ORGANISM="Licmophora paradoxa, Strain CCMP2313" /LENGTH=41 /DNA_ID= /DNA_START= /DNA_END= /DNA_ORIENTATION=